MSKAYFLKEFPDNKVHLSNGQLVKWTLVGHGLGVLETEDELALKELGKAASTGAFGVSAITAEYFEELKKNTSTSGAPLKKEWRPTVTGEPEKVAKGPKAKANAEKGSSKSSAAAESSKPEVEKTDAPATSTGAPV